MKKIFNEDMLKQIIVYSSSLIIAIGVYVLLSKIPAFASAIQHLISIMLPFIVGAILAFILYRPQLLIENFLKSLNLKIKDSKIRLISTLLVFLVTILIIVLIVCFTIPAIISSTQIFASNIGIYGNTLYRWLMSIIKQFNLSPDLFEPLWNQLNITNRIYSYLTNVIPKIANYSYSFISGTVNFFLALVSGIYILIDHENLLRMIKKFIFAILDTDAADFISTWFIDAKTIFQKYIVGSLADSALIGGITYIAMTVLKIPYAPLIGIIIGLTNIIPVFGPVLGAVPVAFLLLLIKPIYCLIFLIFIIIVQQVDGNVIKPIILGDQLGISGFWILFSVTVGGALFGVVGMLLAVPIFALIYQSVKRIIDRQLYKKKIKI